MKKILIIQTAFLGDVVLATSVVEKLKAWYPDAIIDFMLRKGNEALLENNPHLDKVWVWDKKKDKKINLVKIALKIRKERYSHVINLHRFAASGIVTFLSGAKYKVGYDKNPFSFCYTKKVKHIFSEPYTAKPIHETDRYQMLISDLTDDKTAMPKLYPSDVDYARVAPLKSKPYICIAPSSVWFTKKFPEEKWVVLIDSIPEKYTVYLLGAPSEKEVASNIMATVKRPGVENLFGQLSYLESCALMKDAAMNYSNDSGPLHFASAMNASITAVFCSTVPAFGFGPLSDNRKVIEVSERLYCRPCGIHGYNACPEKHFRCAWQIENEQLLWWI